MKFSRKIIESNIFLVLFFSNENNFGFHMRYNFFKILLTILVSSPKQQFYTISQMTVRRHINIFFRGPLVTFG